VLASYLKTSLISSEPVSSICLLRDHRDRGREVTEIGVQAAARERVLGKVALVLRRVDREGRKLDDFLIGGDRRGCDGHVRADAGLAVVGLACWDQEAGTVQSDTG